MKKLILLAFILIALISEVKAQPGVGCFRETDGLVYSQKNVLGFYELLGNRYSTSPPSCPRVLLGTKTGSKCQFIALGTLHDEYNYVLYTATGPVQCDLDHYSYGALALAGFFVVMRMRSRK